MSVFVLDCHKKPLMPCSEKRARLLLSRKRAVVHRLAPFTIRLKERLLQESTIQPVLLKLDPGSKVTGVALARVQRMEAGEIHHALHLAHLEHRGETVHTAMQRRGAIADAAEVPTFAIALPGFSIGVVLWGGSRLPCAHGWEMCSPGPNAISAGCP